MDLSIIILNYKQKGLVKQCIKGILAANPALDYEIIVVDNDSQDGCLEAVKELFKARIEAPLSTPSLLKKLESPLPPLVTIQSEQNGGFANGNNLGIKKAQGKYVMILNPDIAIVSSVLEKMVKFMEEYPQVGIIGPKLINPDGSIQDSCRRFPSWPIPILRRTILGKLPSARKRLDYYLMKDKTHHGNQTVDWLFGACLLIRKSVLDKIGLFDERFFMYFEDLDLCRRCWENNFQVYYFSEVEVVHYHQRLSAEKSGVLGVFDKAGRIHLLSGMKYFAKYLGAKLPNRSLDKN
ncbi:MAG: hypothetical protein A3J62_03720 [Candidatus Buchananbacteria bacterium RIFCSPHIGHO2_02_FULL_38_8]|uniref:Glycosyltransferase 2-like domain-containing protein n=2 Tax=Candidatus Buchananiibacteriota TaxID=1817903 RepID=A0A1G1Y0I5_9BACT|nr:hypothetical protein [uncultured bacterium]OGY45808.1 MAG: hypothetical protein A2731_03950 [Candidatus Buchananbacteria bacterium RIFCSPHIGHO2_01_FULL_39_8]OGY47512.1 MAG: hypothetical protein A3J62_03720 [Candidatus Buchananbacteria bacterium RIFCSPHIGHO2_02_FULL_38_8]